MNYCGRICVNRAAGDNTSSLNRQPDRLYERPAAVLDQVPSDTADLSVPTVAEHTTRTLEPVDREWFE